MNKNKTKLQECISQLAYELTTSGFSLREVEFRLEEFSILIAQDILTMLAKILKDTSCPPSQASNTTNPVGGLVSPLLSRPTAVCDDTSTPPAAGSEKSAGQTQL